MKHRGVVDRELYLAERRYCTYAPTFRISDGGNARIIGGTCNEKTPRGLHNDDDAGVIENAASTCPAGVVLFTAG